MVPAVVRRGPVGELYLGLVRRNRGCRGALLVLLRLLRANNRQQPRSSAWICQHRPELSIPYPTTVLITLLRASTLSTTLPPGGSTKAEMNSKNAIMLQYRPVRCASPQGSTQHKYFVDPPATAKIPRPRNPTAQSPSTTYSLVSGGAELIYNISRPPVVSLPGSKPNCLQAVLKTYTHYLYVLNLYIVHQQIDHPDLEFPLTITQHLFHSFTLTYELTCFYNLPPIHLHSTSIIPQPCSATTS